MKTSFLLGAVLMCFAPAWAADAGPFAFPAYRDAAAVKAQCDTTLLALEARRKSIGAVRAADGVLVALDQLEQTVEDELNPLFFLANVHPDKPLRDASEACELRFQSFNSRLYQDARIFARLKALAPGDAIDASLRTRYLEAFEDAGSALSEASRARARRLNEDIAQLGQTFERRVRETKTRVPFTEAELEGVNASVWKNAPRDAQGRVLLGLDYPSYQPVLMGARNAAARERMWRAFTQRGGPENIRTLAELAHKRREYAGLFGQASYADFALRRRMAQSVPKVQAFLAEVKGVVQQRELRDLADLRTAKATEVDQKPEAVLIKRWDAPYYTERVKQQRFALDQDSFRPHFPPQASADFVMALSGRLFGVNFKPLQQTLWHPDAKAYGVYEQGAGTGQEKLLATIYLDLYPRENKFSHAAVWSLRGSSTLAGRLPTAALVTNIDREGLTIDELETLLHEFGHALHTALSATRYSGNAGTSVKLDFVEAPSQMLEEWVYDARVLALFQEVCRTCPPVPADLLQQAVLARGFAKGIQYARQHLYASYDMALNTKDAPEPLATWARMEGATPIGHEKGSLFPASFSHLTSQYGAGYYAYLWSLATAHDLYTAFAADPLSAAVGRRYRETVLANGGQVDPTELVSRFLGRAPNNAAFFKWLDE